MEGRMGTLKLLGEAGEPQPSLQFQLSVSIYRKDLDVWQSEIQ